MCKLRELCIIISIVWLSGLILKLLGYCSVLLFKYLNFIIKSNRLFVVVLVETREIILANDEMVLFLLCTLIYYWILWIFIYACGGIFVVFVFFFYKIIKHNVLIGHNLPIGGARNVVDGCVFGIKESGETYTFISSWMYCVFLYYYCQQEDHW